MVFLCNARKKVLKIILIYLKKRDVAKLSRYKIVVLEYNELVKTETMRGVNQMIKFGEKVKQLREEKGMTQQTLSERLYVTRQAVSKWERGTRYPDVLTVKKIAQILEVSIDDLLSGEELMENVEKSPILSMPVEHTIQTVLYAIALTGYVLMCMFGIYSLFPSESLAKMPAGQITLTGIGTVCSYLIYAAALSIGLVFSIKNKLNAKVTGYIMCTPYVIEAIRFLLIYIQIQIKHNGYTEISAWFPEFIVPLLIAVYVLLFFIIEERRLPYGIILLICILSIGNLALVMKSILGPYRTDLGLVVITVHCLGKLGMAVLLGYQAYVWDKKRKTGYKNVV